MVSTDTDSLTVAQRERYEAGRALRQQTPRSSHANWQPDKNRPNPIELLIQSSQGRVASLIPLRYGRMQPSPFAFLRGAAAIMAADLAQTPQSGIQVQAGGDCHIANFGGYGTPERELVFDLNDFDETTLTPFEWDVKRLATSIVTAGQDNGLSRSESREVVLAMLQSYREQMRHYAAQTRLTVWYSRIVDKALLEIAETAKQRQQMGKVLQKAYADSGAAFPKLTEVVAGHRKLVDNPPLLAHEVPGEDFEAEIRSVYEQYAQTVRADLSVLLGRYKLVDIALKVVGVGSVGTRCAVVLLMADENDALLLQVKESVPSVLTPYVNSPDYANQGERVVNGQRLMQAASDGFLGWAKSCQDRDFYVRQLRDMKVSINIATLSRSELTRYAALCGWALARAQARAGDPALISGYLGESDSFDQAVADFALDYAEQTERDHAALVAAIQSGRLPSEQG